jgi:hypothetical protein
MGKYLKKSCSHQQTEQPLIKPSPRYTVKSGRRHNKKYKMMPLGLNESNCMSMKRFKLYFEFESAAKPNGTCISNTKKRILKEVSLYSV